MQGKGLLWLLALSISSINIRNPIEVVGASGAVCRLESRHALIYETSMRA